MQNQNQHLLQQIAERDDYNIKVNNLSEVLCVMSFAHFRGLYFSCIF